MIAPAESPTPSSLRTPTMRLTPWTFFLPVAGLALGLAACSVPCDHEIPLIIAGPAAKAPATGQPGRWRITRRNEPLDHRIVLVGEVVPEHPADQPACLVPEDSVRLESLVDTQTAAVRHELHVTDFITSTGWRYWNAAKVANGDTLVFHALDRMVGECSDFSLNGCRHSETFAVDLADTLVRNRLDKGLTVEAGSVTGHSQGFALTAEQLKAQLAAVDALRRTLPQR